MHIRDFGKNMYDALCREESR